MLTLFRLALTFVVLAAPLASLRAEEPGKTGHAVAEAPDWSFEFGGGVIARPRFEGGKGFRFTPFPQFDIAYQDLVFVSAEKGLGVNAVKWEGFKAGPVFKYKPARMEKDSVYLTGLGDVSGTVEGGIFVDYNWMRFLRSRLEIRNGIKGHEGLVLDWEAKATLPILDDLFITAGPRLSASNRVYNQAYFGVDSYQAGRSGYATSKPGAGLRRVGGEAVATYRFNEATRLSTFFQYDRLLGDVAASPLVKGPGGSADQFAAGTTLTYSFDY